MTYPASLRQQAAWVREALDPATPDTQRITLGDVDVEELEAAAARIEVLEAALREYEHDYCEGWCRDAPPQAMFDCGGCRARAALAPEQKK
jgi:hypothetical protein